MKATVNRDECIACELCTETCPGVFKMEDGAAVAYKTPVPAELEMRQDRHLMNAPSPAFQLNDVRL